MKLPIPSFADSGRVEAVFLDAGMAIFRTLVPAALPLRREDLACAARRALEGTAAEAATCRFVTAAAVASAMDWRVARGFRFAFGFEVPGAWAFVLVPPVFRFCLSPALFFARWDFSSSSSSSEREISDT